MIDKIIIYTFFVLGIVSVIISPILAYVVLKRELGKTDIQCVN